MPHAHKALTTDIYIGDDDDSRILTQIGERNGKWKSERERRSASTKKTIQY
jgi:hypothetical protein